jgi:uncharacterized membrane protein YccC
MCKGDDHENYFSSGCLRSTAELSLVNSLQNRCRKHAFCLQNRTGFLLGLALWCAGCGFMATLLRNFAAYSAALAGYTAVIIASDELGATGGASGDAFMLAVTRSSEICIGIVCAGIVLAGTDFGGARRRLAAQFAAMSSEITGRLAGTFLLPGPEQSASRPIRRDLLRRVIALDPVIDEAIGEASDLRTDSPVLQAAMGGLFAALSAWRVVAVHLELLPGDQGRREARLIHQQLPPELLSAPTRGGATEWTDDPSRIRRACSVAVRALAALPDRTLSPRLLADRTAEALIGIERAIDGLLVITDPARATRRSGFVRFGAPDMLPALVNAGRIFVAVVAVELFWIVTAWPNGTQTIVFAAIGVILFSPRADQAYATVMSFMIGVTLTEGIGYIEVTRGVADRDFVFPKDARPTLVMFTQEKRIVDAPAAITGIAGCTGVHVALWSEDNTQ